MRFLQCMKSAGLWAVMIISMAWTAGAAAGAGPQLPGVLHAVSPDPAVLVVIPNLSQFSHKVADLNDRLDLGHPQMTDLLGEFKLQTGIEQGLDEAGSLAIVISDLTGSINRNEEPAFIMLVPVSDYTAFVRNFNGQPGVALTELTMPDGKPGFAKNIGQYAVLGQNRKVVAAYQPSGGTQQLSQCLGKVGQQCMRSSDAVLMINVEKLAPALEPKLQRLIDEAMQQLDHVSTADPAADMLPMGKAVLTMYANAIKAGLRDTSSVVIGLDLSDKGFGLTESAQFKPGSFLAKVFSDGGGAANQLSRLGDQPYLVAMAMDLQGLDCGALVDELLAGLPEEQQLGWLGPVIQQGIALARPLKGVASVYYPPSQPGAMGQNMFTGVAVYHVDDAPAYLRATQKYIEACDAMSFPAAGSGRAADGGADGQPQETTVDATYTPNVLQVDGIQVDQYETRINFPPSAMQEMGPMMPIMMMMGAGGQSGFLAAKGDYVVATTKPDAQLIKRALASLDSQAGLGSRGAIAAVRRSLPADLTYEMYISVTGITDTANSFMTMFGMPPVEAPQNLPPIAMGVAVQNSGVISRLFVPMPVVTFCKDTIDHFSEMSNGNGGGGGNQQRHHRSGPPPAPH